MIVDRLLGAKFLMSWSFSTLYQSLVVALGTDFIDLAPEMKDKKMNVELFTLYCGSNFLLFSMASARHAMFTKA
jgi:hypothetical protein